MTQWKWRSKKKEGSPKGGKEKNLKKVKNKLAEV